MPERPAIARASIGLLLLFSLAACGREESARTSVDIEPLILAPEELDLEVSTYARLEPPAGLEPWRVEAARVEVGPLPGTELVQLTNVLLIWGQGEKRVTIPGLFDPARFNTVELSILVRTTGRVRVNLLRSGRTVVNSRWLSLEPSGAPQRATITFARNELELVPFDALEIVLPPDLGGPVCIVALELRQRPFEAWVLGPDDAPRLVPIGGQHREARGLGGAVERGAVFRAPPGAALELSYGLEPELRLPGQEPVLRVNLRAGAMQRVEELPLEAARGADVRWHFARIPLEDMAGREVTLGLELSGGPHRDAHGYVSELRAVRPAATAPTVLLVTSDTHRADHLGAAEAGVAVDTPALDALAARGVLFERSHSSTNITLPSHAALLTGLSPRDTRIVDNITPLAEEATTLAERFRAAGYRTFAAVSAKHLTPERSGLGQGFERYSAPPDSARDVAATLAELEPWLDDAAGQPLFVWLHLFDAHTPYAPPEELTLRYLDGALAMRSDGAALQELAPEVRLERARYMGEVTKLDIELGRLLELPRFRAGIIAVTADHGECLGQHEVYYDHAGLYPDTVHVPLILAWPGAPAGTRCALPVEHLGLGRTLLELAGLPSADFPGLSLLEALEPGAPLVPLFALSFAGDSAAITLGDLHLILHLRAHRIDKGGRAREFEEHALELYDVAADPACERELSAERPEEARRLRRALIDWLSQALPGGLAGAASTDPVHLAELAKLGYVDQQGAVDGPWIDAGCTCVRCAPWR